MVGLLAILEASDPIKSGTERRLYIERPPPCVNAPEGQALNDWKEKGPTMAKIVNATPHGLQLLAEEDAGDIAGVIGFGRGRTAHFRLVAELAPSGLVPRAATTKVALPPVEVDGVTIPVDRTAYGEVENLPEPDNETTYIVSLLAAQAAAAGGRNTDDLLVIGETVRDADGKIIGATGFGRI